MKTTIIRAVVLTLALVGFGSASVANKAQAAEKTAAVSTGSIPFPMCGPNNGCGMD